MAPDFSWLTEHLAVGGRFAPEHVPALARDHGVAAVIDLRTEERDDEALLHRHGLTFLHLPTEDLCAVSRPMLDEGVAFAGRHLDRGERVLVHCMHGIGRSATLALCVLVARGLTPLEALELAKQRRRAISPSPAQYEAWAAWLREHRAATGAGWEVPAFREFEAIAYRHLVR